MDSESWCKNPAKNHLVVLAFNAHRMGGIIRLHAIFLLLGLCGMVVHAQMPPPDEFDPGANSEVIPLIIQPDGKIVVGGDFTTLGGQARSRIGRLNPDGSLDNGFNPGANGYVFAIAMREAGDLVVAGRFTALGGQSRSIGLLKADGTLDPMFNVPANSDIAALAIQPDGKILVGGDFKMLGGQARSCIGRLKADGTLDTAFAATANDFILTMALQPDGGILLGGSFSSVNQKNRNRLARLNPDGTIDEIFNPDANNQVRCLTVQADGKILVGGWFSTIGGKPRSGIARLNSDGTLDNDFHPQANMGVAAFALQANGKILVGGFFTNIAGQEISRVARLNADGTLDTDGFPLGTDGGVRALELQNDGKLLLAGQFTSFNELSRSRMARIANNEDSVQSLNRDGSTITWLRSGSAPEVWNTTFDYSADSISWTRLGRGERIPGGWRLVAGSLPPGGVIRARGFVASGGGSSGCMVETTTGTVFRVAVDFASMGVSSNGFGCRIDGVFSNSVMVVEGSSDLIHWTALRTNTCNSSVPIPFHIENVQSPCFFYRAMQSPSTGQGAGGRP